MNNTAKYTRVPKGSCPPIQWSRGSSNMTQGSTLAAVTYPFSATVSSVLYGLKCKLAALLYITINLYSMMSHRIFIRLFALES